MNYRGEVWIKGTSAIDSGFRGNLISCVIFAFSRPSSVLIRKMDGGHSRPSGVINYTFRENSQYAIRHFRYVP